MYITWHNEQSSWSSSHWSKVGQEVEVTGTSYPSLYDLVETPKSRYLVILSVECPLWFVSLSFPRHLKHPPVSLLCPEATYHIHPPMFLLCAHCSLPRDFVRSDVLHLPLPSSHSIPVLFQFLLFLLLSSPSSPSLLPPLLLSSTFPQSHKCTSTLHHPLWRKTNNYDCSLVQTELLKTATKHNLTREA